MDSSEDLSLAALASVTASAVSTDAPPIALREYQNDIIERLQNSYRTGHRAPLLVLATGGGKTIIFSAIAYGASRKAKRALVAVHRRELLRQAVSKLALAGVTPGIIAAGQVNPHPEALVTVASIQTLARRLDSLPRYDLIVLDEAHHGVAGQWKKLLESQPSAKLLGVTATAARMDGKGLGVHAGGLFDDLILGPEVSELVANQFLAPAICYIPAGRIDLRGVRVRGGDYETGDLERAVNAAHLTGNAVEQYALRANHLPTIAFCVSVRHAEDVALAFRAAGYRATAVSGRTKAAERDAAIAGLGNGSVEILASCDLISEGVDVPILGCVISLRPTKSLVLHRQQIGRGMRPAEGKPALIVLDHAANALVHGLAETPVQWSLDGLKRKAKPPPTWECECGCINPAHKLVCAGCGFVREVDTPERRIVGEDTGEMLVLTPERLAQLRSIRMEEYCAIPRTEAELTQYAAARGFRHGWVWHQMRKQAEIPPWALQDLP